MADVVVTINGVDRSRQAFQQARDNARGLASTMALLGPAMAPVAAAATVAVAGLASTLGGAAVAAGAFKLAVQPQTQAVADAATAHEKYQTVVRQSGEGSKEAKKALEEYKSQLADMPAATAATAQALVGLKADFKSWSDELAGDTMPIFTQGIGVLRTILPTLTPIVQNTSKVFGELMTRLQKKVESKGFETFMQKVAVWSDKGLRNTIRGIETLVAKISGFVTGDGFQQFLQMGQESGPALGDILKNLARFVGEFIAAAGPLAGLSVLGLQVLADALNAIPQSVLEVLAPTIMAIVVAMKAWRLAVMAATAVQWLWNAAMAANPIGLLVLLIVGLVAAIVALWKKNEGFRNFVIKAWAAIKNAFSVAWVFIRDKVFAPLGRFFTETIPRWATTVKDRLVGAWNTAKVKVGSLVLGLVNWIRDKWNGFIDFFRNLPSRLWNAGKNMFEVLKISFKNAINWMIWKWNNFSMTIGGGSIAGVDIPSLTLNTPNIPYLARGGIAGGLAMVGERGRELVNLPSGSHVRTNADTERILSRGGGGGSGAPMHITLKIGEKTLGDILVDPLRGAVRSRGGNVQAVLGR